MLLTLFCNQIKTISAKLSRNWVTQWKLAATAQKLSPTEGHLHFAKGLVMVIEEKIQSDEPQICEAEPAFEAAESDHSTEECTNLSPASSELGLRGDVDQLAIGNKSTLGRDFSCIRVQ